MNGRGISLARHDIETQKVPKGTGRVSWTTGASAKSVGMQAWQAVGIPFSRGIVFNVVAGSVLARHLDHMLEGLLVSFSPSMLLVKDHEKCDA